MAKNPPANAGDGVVGSISGWEESLEKEMATHSSILAWEIPMDKGVWVWQVIVRGDAKSQTWLSV